MKGDFSRQTFKVHDHYNGVLLQQGRVQLDADWNEQQAIHRHRAETEATDVIGATGAPKGSAGFEVTPQANDLRIGKGHFYVDGILCENEQDVLFTAQPHLRPIDQGLLPTTDGMYVAYLEVWDRHVTALEDGSIRETALGGPDTATRTQVIWQVRLLPVADPGVPVTCETVFPEWAQLLDRNLASGVGVGRMSARSQLEETSPDPLCILPPGTGYHRLDNQLYRVEVHVGGDRTEARFKWSRDNGTVASAIEPDQNGTVVSGSEIVVADIGRDKTLSFASDPLPEWLELTDDRHELQDQRGVLAQVQAVDPATRRITFVQGALPALDATQHPVVRRWDQRGASATNEGVAMTGDWQALEDGVEVRFEAGRYRQGDHWLVPARTAIGFEAGTVEWPHDGTNPLSEAPHGTRHHLARLALLDLNAGAFTLLPDSDCRTLFPPLTAITAADVGFSDAACQLGGVDNVQEALDVLCQRYGSACSLLVGPGEDLAVAVNALADVQDALICLHVGTYELSQPLRIEKRRHIQVVGAGPGTRIVGGTSEAALVFNDCETVKVSNLHVETGAVRRGGASRDHVNGALTFLNCRSVTVEGASVRGAGGPIRAGSCITVRHDAPSLGSQARVHGCDLEAGHLQVGVLLANVDRVDVSDNFLRAGARPPDDELLQDIDYRAALRRQLLSGIVASTGPAPPPNTNATVTFNGRVVHFRSDSGLLHGNRNDTEWQRATNAIAPAGITSPATLERFLLRLASELLRTRGNGQGGSQPFRSVIATLLAQDTPAAEQAIVLGGTLAADVRVSGNTVRDAAQGVHVGLGQGASSSAAGVVFIEGNTIRVSLPSSATRERHGIFVGPCNSLLMEGNFISIVRAQRNASLRAEGIRVFGNLGRRAIVRHNHMGPTFAVGITFAPLNQPVPPQPLWIVTENEMESATTKVDIPAKGPGRPGVVQPEVVRQRVRGINDNFA